MPVKPTPEGHHSLTPYIVVNDARRFMDFLKRAFDAKEIAHFNMPDGSIGHAEMKLGDSRLMLGQANERWKPATCALYYYTPNVDSVYKKALAAGAASSMEPADKFYGDRSASVRDPFGNQWHIATHIEDVSSEELQRRLMEQMKQPVTH
jgi:PhnB protein